MKYTDPISFGNHRLQREDARIHRCSHCIPRNWILINPFLLQVGFHKHFRLGAESQTVGNRRVGKLPCARPVNADFRSRNMPFPIIAGRQANLIGGSSHAGSLEKRF